ncbi:hypothetical protein G6O69_31995 [Pseudenhygromyxa sp. WMMC2535]|uniref:hypothetical protein n=1 Tax=Pseudenhygromyxa sp. WMMC2535 TaxID=2712867 RepID=UPI0015559842|nr:hypothetical protein [Pseudenhygromyxa sp. WMMC2535]NVB42489.1 hypothetical protein [Pseudenhygromyxa sp. WMMC2535]
MAVLSSFSLACSDSSGGTDEADETMGEGEDETAEESASGSEDSSDSADTSTDSADTDGSETDSADAGTEGTDESGETDGVTEGLALALLPSSYLVLEADNEGALSASCALLEDGLPAAEQPAFSYALSPAEGVEETAEGWAFPEFGTWNLSCSATVDGELLEVEGEIAVLDDAIDPRFATLGGGLGSSVIAALAVLAADGGDDQLLADAVAELEAAQAEIAAVEIADLDDVLRPVPHGYPTTAALEQAGIAATADDDALAPALDEVAAALDDLEAFYAGLDPASEPTQADLDQLELVGSTLSAALDAASALEPTVHGWLANRESLALLTRDRLAPAVAAVNAYIIARAQIEAEGVFGYAPASKGVSARFGLFGVTLGLFNQSYIRIKLVNEWYGDAFAALDKSINNLILNDLIDYFLPADPNGPIIDILQASSSVGYALPGYDTWAYGSNFNTDPSFNVFLILGDQWQGIVDSIIDGCGVSEENTIPENYEAFTGCIEDIEDSVDSSILEPGQVIEPGTLGGQDIYLGPFPEACSGSFPVATLVIPINLATGRGETWLTNCISN